MVGFHRIPEEGKPMKRYFLLGCIIAITPIIQSVSANAADLGFAPAPRIAPYVPRTFNWSGGPSWRGGGGCCCCVPPPPPPCCCCGGWSSSGWRSVQWSSGGWGGGGWNGGGGDWGGGGGGGWNGGGGDWGSGGGYWGGGWNGGGGGVAGNL